MDLGIVGLPLSGKTTVFNALTHGHAEAGGHRAGVETHIGVVKVPDERLTKLAAHPEPVEGWAGAHGSTSSP